MSVDRPRPAQGAAADELLERAHRLRTELLRRGEFLPPDWSDEAARDLRSGGLSGFYLSGEAGAPGLAVFSQREGHAFAHVHIDPGDETSERAMALLQSVLGALSPEIRRADVGLSGLEPPAEQRLAEEAVRRFGGEALQRHSMERRMATPLADGPGPPGIPGRIAPLRGTTLDRLAELNWQSYRGSPDERLAAESLSEERRSLGEILDGRLGRVEEGASGVFQQTKDRPLGLIVVAEQAAGRYIVLDLAVDPAYRRQGIGAFLLGTSLERLRALGAELARLWVTDGNLPARRLYDRLGFVRAQSALIYRWSAWGPPVPARSGDPAGSPRPGAG
ncbi:MAG TPA: GNAT family N-acetyltransferase [Thermoplasmata archaeon]|nr:GNAT family N-acetyltransferase [Thermoplasmata archaeon]